jgi:hypothetical protein
MPQNSRRHVNVELCERVKSCWKERSGIAAEAGCIHRTDKVPSRWQQPVLNDQKIKSHSYSGLRFI